MTWMSNFGMEVGVSRGGKRSHRPGQTITNLDILAGFLCCEWRRWTIQCVQITSPLSTMPRGLSSSPFMKPFVVLALPGMYLFYKYNQYRRQQEEQNRRKVTERELAHLNHKIVSSIFSFVWLCISFLTRQNPIQPILHCYFHSRHIIPSFPSILDPSLYHFCCTGVS